MCGRMVQALTSEFVNEALKIRDTNIELKANYNVAPTQMVGVVRLHPKTKVRTLNELRWGLVPSWAEANHRASTINAKAEELANKPMFKGAWEAGRRCLVPINAYYEWTGHGREKQPYAIGGKDEKVITLAGLWEAKKLENGDILRTFTVITTEAQGEMAELHNRIPVMIEETDWEGWLGAVEANVSVMLQAPSNNQLHVWSVNRAVGNVKNNYPSLLLK